MPCIEIRSRSAAGASCTGLSRSVDVLVSGNVADANTPSRTLDVGSEDATTLTLTVSDNDFDNAGSGDEIDVDAEDSGSALWPTLPPASWTSATARWRIRPDRDNQILFR